MQLPNNVTVGTSLAENGIETAECAGIMEKHLVYEFVNSANSELAPQEESNWVAGLL